MINAKKIYNALLSDERITALVSDENILNAHPGEVEIFPCIIFTDENQVDSEYHDNKAGASECYVTIDIYSKKLEGYYSTSEIGTKVAEVMNDDLWHCSQNGELGDPNPDVEHRVMRFGKSIFIDNINS